MLRRIGSADTGAALALLVNGLGKADDSTLQLTFLNAIQSALLGQRQVAAPDGWNSVYTRLADNDEDSVRLQAMSLGVKFGDEAAIASFPRSGRREGCRHSAASRSDRNSVGGKRFFAGRFTVRTC